MTYNKEEKHINSKKLSHKTIMTLHKMKYSISNSFFQNQKLSDLPNLALEKKEEAIKAPCLSAAYPRVRNRPWNCQQKNWKNPKF